MPLKPYLTTLYPNTQHLFILRMALFRRGKNGVNKLMNKTLERRLRLKSSVGVVDADLSWEKSRNRPYLYHVTLTHIPTGMEIEQASESSFADAKGYCLGELNWRLRHWTEYKKSRMDDTIL